VRRERGGGAGGDIVRHLTAHVMAQGVQQLFLDAKLFVPVAGCLEHPVCLEEATFVRGCLCKFHQTYLSEVHRSARGGNVRFHCLSIPITPRRGHASEGEMAVYADLIERARTAEDQGFTGFWVAEHHFGRYGGAVPFAGVLLAHLAARTERIRLGAGVAVLSLRRDPIATLEEFAMVDALSGGRLELGVGRGFMDHEFAGKGVALEDRGSIFDEGLDIMERFFAGNLPNPTVTPPPTQLRVPIWVAVSTNLESCRRAAASGHGLMLNPYNRKEEETQAAIDCYLEDWARHAHGAPPRILVNQLLFVAASETQLRRQAEESVNSYLDAVADAIEGGTAARLLPRKQFADLCSGRALFGTPSLVTERLLTYEKMGVTDVSLMTHVGDPVSAYANESTEIFCREVMPNLVRDV
jgi:alkanesulfonate monooxygenase SsuD/methylene tetrahydromethanopterin reductase-like flavin-dependent oxidoreductase (luciferase family)